MPDDERERYEWEVTDEAFTMVTEAMSLLEDVLFERAAMTAKPSENGVLVIRCDDVRAVLHTTFPDLDLEWR